MKENQPNRFTGKKDNAEEVFLDRQEGIMPWTVFVLMFLLTVILIITVNSEMLQMNDALAPYLIVMTLLFAKIVDSNKN